MLEMTNSDYILLGVTSLLIVLDSIMVAIHAETIPNPKKVEVDDNSTIEEVSTTDEKETVSTEKLDNNPNDEKSK